MIHCQAVNQFYRRSVLELCAIFETNIPCVMCDNFQQRHNNHQSNSFADEMKSFQTDLCTSNLNGVYPGERLLVLHILLRLYNHNHFVYLSSSYFNFCVFTLVCVSKMFNLHLMSNARHSNPCVRLNNLRLCYFTTIYNLLSQFFFRFHFKVKHRIERFLLTHTNTHLNQLFFECNDLMQRLHATTSFCVEAFLQRKARFSFASRYVLKLCEYAHL